MRPFFKSVTLFKLLALLGICLFSAQIQALSKPIPKPPAMDVSSYILLDYNSENILAEFNPDNKIEPASITKLMSMYIIDKALADGDIQKSDEVTVSEKAWRMKGSKMFIEVGKQVSVEDLIRGIIIQSGNDATIALAEHIAGSEEAFVAYMNHQAELLGMSNTHFSNVTGWPDENHYSSARDLAKLAKAIIQDFPQSYELYREKEFTFNNIRQFNRNKLLWRDDTVDGLKTGHTEAAGYCLVASAKRDNTRLISIVLGAKSDKARTRHSQALLNYGYRYFETHRLYQGNDTLKQARVWFGTAETVNLGLQSDLYINIPKGRYNDLKATLEIDSTIEAPIQKGQELGQVVIKMDGELVEQQPLIALSEVAHGGFIKKTLDSLKRVFQ